ncbi:hypothetical protein BC628DRAFT_785481 [Trametes gibbosa]|nr:hypothetical protein BC628DRAFT_785481 [Trametes gibbosa]
MGRAGAKEFRVLILHPETPSPLSNKRRIVCCDPYSLEAYLYQAGTGPGKNENGRKQAVHRCPCCSTSNHESTALPLRCRWYEIDSARHHRSANAQQIPGVVVRTLVELNLLSSPQIDDFTLFPDASSLSGSHISFHRRYRVVPLSSQLLRRGSSRYSYAHHHRVRCVWLSHPL